MIQKQIKFIKFSPVHILLTIGLLAVITIGCKSLSLEKSKKIGCNSLSLEKPKKNKLATQELELLKNGYEVFVQTDYEKAAQIYNSLYKQSQNIQTRQWALYGLACIGLTKAENKLQFDEAISLWNQWQQSVPETFSGEDPRMMGPYIKKAAPPCKMEIEIKLLMDKNTALEKEIMTLKHQISSLEAIDQKIEEKKKEISSP